MFEGSQIVEEICEPLAPRNSLSMTNEPTGNWEAATGNCLLEPYLHLLFLVEVDALYEADATGFERDHDR